MRHTEVKMRKKIAMLLVAAMLAALFQGCGEAANDAGRADASVSRDGEAGTVSSDASGEESKFSAVADPSENTAEKIDDSLLTPVTADMIKEGEYLVDTSSSSPVFKVADTLLVVSGNSMEAILIADGDTGLLLYPGTAGEAASDSEENYISFEQNDTGAQLYKVPVEAMDKALPFAVFGREKEKWYDGELLFDSSSLLDDDFRESRYKTVSALGIEDGTYYIDVDLKGEEEGGELRSPTLLLIEDGQAAALITWTSPDYKHMTMDGFSFDGEAEEEESTFVFPVKGFDHPIAVTVESVSGNRTTETECTLKFDSSSISIADPEGEAPYYGNMRIKERIKPLYARGYSVDSFGDNIYRINVGKKRYLLVPRLKVLPYGIPESVTVIRTPVNRAYLATVSGMEFIRDIDAVSHVGFAIRDAVNGTEDGIVDAGEASEPDCEALKDGRADIAIEDQSADSDRETLKKLEEIPLPVFIDRSESETDEKGRMEWIKLYGLLTGEYGRALRYFDAYCKEAEAASGTVSR